MPLVPPKSSTLSTELFRLQAGAVVEYEQHGRPHLAMAISEKKGKWETLNLLGEVQDLASNRLYLLPQSGASLPSAKAPRDEKIQALRKIQSEAAELEPEIDLENLWQQLAGEKRSLTVAQLSEKCFGSNQLIEHLALRHALIADKVFFKRDNQAFLLRPAEQVEELKNQAREEAAQRARREGFLRAILERLAGREAEIDPSEAQVIAELAALGGRAERAKLAERLLDEICERAGLALRGKSEDRAFQLLVQSRIFTANQDLNLVRYRRSNNFPAEVLAEARTIAAAPSDSSQAREDLRALNVITIDGVGTRDMDDALSVERLPGGYRLGIHITDVASAVRDDGRLFADALARATSIYASDYVVGMMPAELAESKFSLMAGAERPVQSFFLELDQEFNIKSRRITAALIRVVRCWNYDEADEALYAGADNTDPDLHLLWQISSALEMRRMNAGAQQFQRREMAARLQPDGSIRLETATDDTPSRKLVGEMMIVANETAGLFAAEHGLAAAFRSQPAPDGDIFEAASVSPAGPAREYHLRSLLKRSTVDVKASPHYGLGLKAYVQVTSPIRRALDLVCQAQLAAFLRDGQPRYSPEEMQSLIAAAENGLIEAARIQRDRNRYWLLRYIEQEKFKELAGVIVRVDRDKPVAEIEELFMLHPFKSREVQAGRAVPPGRLGERVRLRIERLNAARDYLILAEA